MIKRWIACKNQKGEHYAHEINVQETKQTYLVYEKNNHPGSEMWRNIARYLGYRTRLSKSDPRLFESPEALYADLINRLEASRRAHEEAVDSLTQEIARLRTQIEAENGK